MNAAQKVAYASAQAADDKFQELCDQFRVDRYNRVQVEHIPHVKEAHRLFREACEALHTFKTNR